MNYIIISKEQSTKMEVGTLINNENGTNGGIVTEIIPDGDNAKVYGTWNEPTPGEKWLWSHVKEVIDNGGHRNLNGKTNYGPQSKRWQGNRSTGAIKEMHLTEQDFTGKNPRIVMNCWIMSIEMCVSKMTNDIEIANVDPYETIFRANESGKRTFYPYRWSKHIDMVGSGGRFDIIIRWKSF